MSVTLSEVKRAARAHRAPLAGESAGYLVLAIADQVLNAPRLVQAADIQLTEDGALRVVSGRASSDAEAELALRRALDQLLFVASSGSAALTRAARRTAPLGLSALVRELEAALIPVNRAAARRALARVHRETARALASGHLPEDEEEHAAASPLEPAQTIAAAEPAILPVPAPSAAVAVAMTVPVSEGPVTSLAAPLRVEAREPTPEIEAEPDLEQDLETPALQAAVSSPPPALGESRLDGVISALCEQLPAPPQFVESDALTYALAVRAVSVPAPIVSPEPEPEFLLDVDVEFEADVQDTEAVDSSAAPTVMRTRVEPVALAADEARVEPPLLDLPLEARTRPEPVVLRKTLRPPPELPPLPTCEAVNEAAPETPTWGTLAAALPILAPEQIAEMTVAASRALELSELARESHERTERMPDVLPLPPGAPLAPGLCESSKSDVSELVQSFQVAEPDISRDLCRAIKEMADLDRTPAPFAALIR